MGGIELPEGSTNPIAALTVDGQYFQDNSIDPHAHQYWTNIDDNCHFQVDRVREGKYRLTIYATGMFGHFVHVGSQYMPGKQPLLLNDGSQSPLALKSGALEHQTNLLENSNMALL